MVVIYELVQPEMFLQREEFFKLMRHARQIALEIPGVYDLALYQTEQSRNWRCSVEMDGPREWGLLQADERFRQLWSEIQELGVQIIHADHLERRI